jgi:hypothetical protein
MTMTTTSTVTVTVEEDRSQYKGEELAICLQQP